MRIAFAALLVSLFACGEDRPEPLPRQFGGKLRRLELAVPVEVEVRRRPRLEVPDPLKAVGRAFALASRRVPGA